MQNNPTTHIYLDGFTSWEDVRAEFSNNRYTEPFSSPVPEQEPEYVFASYEIDGYEGSAHIIYYDGNKWWYVYGSHCSCFGLENQWEPEVFEPYLYLNTLKDSSRAMLSIYNDDLELQVVDWLKDRLQ